MVIEIDLLLENTDFLMAVGIKSTPKLKDIKHHIRRLNFLRRWRDRFGDSRKIRGAIAGAIYDDIVKQATHEEGLYVIEQSGDTMKIDLPDGFKPREW